MKRLLLACSFACSTMFALVGCGGHEGGVVDIPLSENPYQISEREQQAINATVDETKDLTEEEIEALEQAKLDALEAASGETGEGSGDDAAE